MNLIEKYNDKRIVSKLTPSQLVDRNLLLRAIMRKENFIIERGRRTGKSTILASIAEELNIPYVSANEVMRRRVASEFGTKRTFNAQNIEGIRGYSASVILCDDMHFYADRIPDHLGFKKIGFH